MTPVKFQVGGNRINLATALREFITIKLLYRVVGSVPVRGLVSEFVQTSRLALEPSPLGIEGCDWFDQKPSCLASEIQCLPNSFSWIYGFYYTKII